MYEGEYNAAGQREGHGTLRFASGNVYEGELKADKQEGHGTERYASGNVYEGQWKAGKKEGRGMYRFASGNVYDGEWKEDKKHGPRIAGISSKEEKFLGGDTLGDSFGGNEVDSDDDEANYGSDTTESDE